MKRLALAAALLMLTCPAQAAENKVAPAIQEIAPPETGYTTFPLQPAKGSTGGGCLWRLPGGTKDGLEFYAAMTMVRVPTPTGSAVLEASLQLAGAQEKNGEKVTATFKDLRLTAGDFDTAKIATEKESGNTARVTFPSVQAMAMVTAIADHGATLHFASGEDNKHEEKLAKPGKAEAAEIWDCLTKLQPAAKEEKPGDKKK